MDLFNTPARSGSYGRDVLDYLIMLQAQKNKSMSVVPDNYNNGERHVVRGSDWLRRYLIREWSKITSKL